MSVSNNRMCVNLILLGMTLFVCNCNAFHFHHVLDSVPSGCTDMEKENELDFSKLRAAAKLTDLESEVQVALKFPHHVEKENIAAELVFFDRSSNKFVKMTDWNDCTAIHIQKLPKRGNFSSWIVRIQFLLHLPKKCKEMTHELMNECAISKLEAGDRNRTRPNATCFSSTFVHDNGKQQQGQPDQISPMNETSTGWNSTYTWIAIIIGVLALISAFLLWKFWAKLATMIGSLRGNQDCPTTATDRQANE